MAVDHPLYNVPTDATIRLIWARDADVVMVEEVLTWNTKIGGSSPMCEFINVMRRKYTGIEVAKLDASPFIIGSRPRFFMACCQERVGGQAAAKEWAMHVDDVVNFRKSLGPPTPLLGPNAIFSDLMIEQAKEQIANQLLIYEDLFSYPPFPQTAPVPPHIIRPQWTICGDGSALNVNSFFIVSILPHSFNPVP